MASIGVGIQVETQENENLKIEGINTDVGIKRVANNKRLYIDLLKRFAEKYEKVAEQIATHRIKGDYSKLEYLAHSMKGASGNIGAETLYFAFSELEKISKNRGELESCIVLEGQIAIEMEKIIKSIDKAFSSSINAEDVISDTLSIKQIHEIIKHLEKGNGEAVDLWKDIKTAFEQVHGISKTKIIDGYIREYKFDEAIQYLNNCDFYDI